MFTNKKYILASSSISRFKILKNSGFVFKQISPLCNEENIKKKIKLKTTQPSIVAKKLSYEKAKSISIKKKYCTHYVIGCDTLVYLDKKIYDKAKNIREAKNKLLKLSGRQHKIVSAITICKNGEKIWQSTTVSKVKIRKIKRKEIDLYLKKTGKKILQSVGCYQVESLGPQIIEDISGDFFNVMGLPLFKLLKYIYYKWTDIM